MLPAGLSLSGRLLSPATSPLYKAGWGLAMVERCKKRLSRCRDEKPKQILAVTRIAFDSSAWKKD
jgi:hypothetical protein